MSHHPYPDRDRALHQVRRHHDHRVALPDAVITITADATVLTHALHQAQAAGLFALHPDLADLDATLDNLFPGS